MGERKWTLSASILTAKFVSNSTEPTSPVMPGYCQGLRIDLSTRVLMLSYLSASAGSRVLPGTAGGLAVVAGGSALEGSAREFLETLQTCFADRNDPRVQASCDHLLLDIIAITILAVTCGADDWTDLETFGNLRHDWLKTFLKLPKGIPSHDTFRRVFGLLGRKQFAACLFQWTQAIHEATGGKLIAIDGKALRRSFAKKSGKAMLHLVTAW